jgi:hypothetical protein
MPLEPPTPGSPEDWLRHARSDLTLAQRVLDWAECLIRGPAETEVTEGHA